ncbi:MAG TPA: ABC transporter ATP-binding protein [Pyrinomonadaceae bacterium]|nr:ABC transporter ATP-binding protein [Pyrinomonadaceae bacterium]
MKPIIRVENLSKEYKIGASREPYSTLRESIINSVKALLQRRGNGEDKTFQVLKDINFEITPGEIVGVIGRNGAGKSTLLKILSRITEPTSGRIELYGRVGSLLEVGTGFHPELTGRENIFLNGAILGMKRGEIVDKFDEIAAFAEIGEFLDTPVKRYSSGMYTRLAFSVAAHLESEVLVVDEVLAVGDAEFQKKCLGKMKDVSHSGRTVLFVSHNMVAVKNLCRRAIFLQKGELRFDSTADAAIEMYLQTGIESSSERLWTDAEMPGNETVKVRRTAVYAENKLPNDVILTNSDVVFEIEFYNNSDDADLDVTWDLMDTQGAHVAHIGTVCSESGKMKRGFYKTIGVFPKNILNTKRYVLSVQFGRSQRELLLRLEDVLTFEVEDGLSARGSNFSQFPGVVHPKCEWRTVPEG